MANQWPSSSNSISGWSMWLIRMRLAMVCRKRWLVAEGLLAME